MSERAQDFGNDFHRDAGETIRRPLLPTDTLFFLHMPKCGGTTFTGLLRQFFRRPGEVYSNPYFRQELLDTPADELRCYRLIRGHFPYPDVVRKLGFRPRTVTFLRDPVTRFISHYRMCKHPRWQPVSQREQDYQAELNRISFQQFLDRLELTNVLANLQYRYMAGFHVDKAGRHHGDFDQPCDGLLDHFELAGILERFDESLEAFCFTFDLPPITTYPQRNVSPDRNQAPQLSAESLDRVAEINRHDVELYAAAQRRFERQRCQILSFSDGPPTFEVPQEVLRLDMSRVPPGNNWWEGMGDPSHSSGRWTGPGRTANLYVTLSPGSKTVRLTVAGSAVNDVLRSLRLLVEGTEVPLRRKFGLKQFPRIYTATIPGALIRDRRRTRLSLQVAQTRPPWPGAPREAGIRLSNLEISPAGGIANCTGGDGRRSAAA